MKRFVAILAVSLAGALPAVSQSLEDLNIQIHGYATQGFLYTTNNNMFTTESNNGSPAWTEAVVNVGAQPMPKLRVGVQARYFLLGNFGNEITLDWAAADYKANDKFGVRFGKVKTPSGLFNETQDIDPSYLWSLLPQSVYPIESRNSILATYGGVVYGTLNLQKAGKLEYRGWGGEREIKGDDGYWVSLVEEGFTLPTGYKDAESGGALHWKTPVSGLMLGASLIRYNASSEKFVYTTEIPAGPSTGITITIPGTMTTTRETVPDFFGRYEKKRLMFAAERNRQAGLLAFAGLSPIPDAYDLRGWYAMTSYKVSDKFTAGVYDSQYSDPKTALGPSRYSKDWAISGRYDFNQYLYAKAEQHFIEGTAIGYDANLNPPTAALPTGLQPNTKLTILKMGVSF